MEQQLDPQIAERIPETIVIYGLTEVQGVANAEALRYFATLDLDELRRRQAVCRDQQELLYQQDVAEQRVPFGGRSISEAVADQTLQGLHLRDRAGLRLQVEDDLLTQAVGLISFEDWIVPEEINPVLAQ
jgi:hypothetical protein